MPMRKASDAPGEQRHYPVIIGSGFWPAMARIQAGVRSTYSLSADIWDRSPSESP